MGAASTLCSVETTDHRGAYVRAKAQSHCWETSRSFRFCPGSLQPTRAELRILECRRSHIRFACRSRLSWLHAWLPSLCCTGLLHCSAAKGMLGYATRPTAVAESLLSQKVRRPINGQ